MPAKSKAQQQMFGIAHAIQKGTMPASKARGPATDVAKAAKPKDVKAIASTPTKNLPKKVKKKVKTEDVRKIREYVTKVVREVLAEAQMTRNGPLNSVKVIEWVPGKWWVVRITNKDGSYTPLKGEFKNRKAAEGWRAKNLNEVLSEWSVAPPNTGSGQSEWEIWNGGKIQATAPNKEAATKLKNQMKLKEGVTLKEAADTWTLEWYDSKKGKWNDTEFTSASIAKKAEKRARTLLRQKGDNNPDHVVLKKGKRTSMFSEAGKTRDVFYKHQLKIARDTLKMSDQGAFIMGGMTKDAARAFLKKHGLKEGKRR